MPKGNPPRLSQWRDFIGSRKLSQQKHWMGENIGHNYVIPIKQFRTGQRPKISIAQVDGFRYYQTIFFRGKTAFAAKRFRDR